jgi:hypothetical protein
MHTILAILLYLRAICPCNYNETQMNDIIAVHQQEITNIENDPALTQQIETEYGDEADIVVIWPDGAGYTE